MSKRFTLDGIGISVELGDAGVRIKDDGTGQMDVRDSADAIFENVALADAIVDDHAVTLRQLNTAILGLLWKADVRVATTVPGALATDFENGDVIDGIALVTGNRILIKDQAAGAENGIYIVEAAGAPTRAADMAAGTSAVSATVPVNEGTVNADLAFRCTNDAGSGVVGVDALVFVLFAPGISTISDAAGATGSSIIDSGTAPDATLRTILGAAPIAVAVVGDDVVISSAALGGTQWRRVAFAFGTASPFNIGAALPANALVIETRVTVDNLFDQASTLTIGDAGSPAGLQGVGDNDLERAGLYVADNDDTSFAGSQLIGTYVANGAAAGDGFVLVGFIIT